MKIRIYFEGISIGKKLDLTTIQAHYLFKVMRQKNGDIIYIFNEKDGEFECKILEISQTKCVAVPEKLHKKYEKKQKIVCVFSVIKQKNIELIVQKCTEIGVCEFLPIMTERSQSEKINFQRLQTIAIEACEQCGRIDVPKICNPVSLENLAKMQKQGRAFVLLHQDGEIFTKKENFDEMFVISGPEGGFSQKEIEFLQQFSSKMKISNNILRAETASILGCGLVML